MEFSASALLEKVIRFKSIQHKDGKLLLWGIPGTLSPLYTSTFFLGLINSQLGKEQTAELFFNLGYYQGKETFKIISQKFGFAKTFNDQKKLLEFNTQQAPVVGNGIYKWVRMDFESKHFIVVGNSPFAEEYKKMFGISNSPIDYFMAGQITGYAESVVGDKLMCVETKCIANGKQNCEFVVKPINEIKKEYNIKIPKILFEQTNDNIKFK